MSAEEVLRLSDEAALYNNQATSFTSGKNKSAKKTKFFSKARSFRAMGLVLIAALIGIFVVSSGQYIPASIPDKILKKTNFQYADSVRSNMLIFQQSLENGEIAEDKVEILKENNILVGYLDNEDNFIESNKNSGGLSLKSGNRIIPAKDFVTDIIDYNDTELYGAFKEAIYDESIGFFDESAEKVFQEIGTTRNNFTRDSDFEEVINSALGEGSDYRLNTISLTEKTRYNEETGKTETYLAYEKNGEDAISNTKAEVLINEVSSKNASNNTKNATLNSADALTVADTMSKKQRSSLFYALVMENISKMKAGDGNDAKVNEVMNFLYKKAETKVVDVKTGEVKIVEGSPLDSPSLYALLADKKVNTEEAGNYSNERILKTVENQLGVSNASSVTNGTVAATGEKRQGSIGRLINEKVEEASTAILQLVSPTIESSLGNNSSEDLKGIAAGELLVEGAVNVGIELANESGATGGDAEAVNSYANMNTTILALDAKVDRINKNPLDMTSKNTFLGSIVHNIIANLQSNNILGFIIGNIASINNTKVFADDNQTGFLGSYGECEKLSELYGAVGTAQCDVIPTFDTSTLDDPFNNPEFIQFVEQNTTLNSSGERVVKADSILKEFIDGRNKKTPLGVKDGEILETRVNGSSSGSNLEKMIEASENASEEDIDIATGKAFINSTSNPKWKEYKYAQRYISLARAADAQKLYAKDQSTYVSLKFFEGYKNPITTLLDNDISIANN